MSDGKQETSTQGTSPTEEENKERNKEKILKFREKLGLATPPSGDLSDVMRKEGNSRGRISPRPENERISPRDTGRISPRPQTGRMSPRNPSPRRPSDGRYSPRHPSPVGLYRQEGDRPQSYGIPAEQDTTKLTTSRRGSDRKSAAPRRHSDRKNISEPDRRLEKAKEELRRAREKMGLETPKPWKNLEHDVIHLTYSGPEMDYLSHNEKTLNDSGLSHNNSGPTVQNGYLPHSGQLSHSGQFSHSLSLSGQYSHSGQLSPSGYDSGRGQNISGQDSSRSQQQLINSGNSTSKGQLAYNGNDTGKGQHLYVVEGTKSTLPA